MTEIFLVRHGEAEGNLYRRAQGQTDVALTPRGVEQTKYLNKRFADIPLAAAYSSDLCRAISTITNAIEGKNLPIQIVPGLKEMNLGIWENEPWGNIGRDMPEQLRNFSLDPDAWDIPGGENHKAVQDRMEQALLQIGAAHPGQKVICGSHGMAIRALIARVLNIQSKDIGQLAHADNTSVSLLTYQDGKLHLEYMNDVSHLPEGLSTLGKQNWWKSNTGNDSHNLAYTPFDSGKELEHYLDCYSDAWRIAHGSLQGFDKKACAKSTSDLLKHSPYAIQTAWMNGETVGYIAMDDLRGKATDAGWVAFCYVVPEHRNERCGLQLIGTAIAHYRDLGRTKLQLTVAPTNPAVGFYQYMGFEKIGEEPGAIDNLWIMEKKI